MLYQKPNQKQIIREQRQRQDKLLKAAEEMGSYSSDKLFNKWHNERLLQTVINKNTFKEVPNERYFSILSEIVRQEYLSKLLKWVSTISEEHKKGLRVIKTVVNMRGTKRFKNKGGKKPGVGEVDLMVGDSDISNAKEIFRKMNTTTSYCGTFGERPKAQEAFMILKSKKFSELAISDILKADIVAILSKWLTINDQDEFTGRIYFTVREMYTVIKNQIAITPTSHDTFSNAPQFAQAKAPRFDQMLIHFQEKARMRNSKSVARPNKVKHDMDKYNFVDIKIGSRNGSLLNPEMRESKYGKIRYDGPPLIDTKDFKQSFLKGNKDAVYYCDPNRVDPSSYQDRFKGIQITSNHAKIVDDGRISCAGNTIPDPHTMTRTGLMFNAVDKDRNNMTRRMFASNGLSQMSPQSRHRKSATLDFNATNASHFNQSAQKMAPLQRL